jgi:hypothetical protein
MKLTLRKILTATVAVLFAVTAAGFAAARPLPAQAPVHGPATPALFGFGKKKEEVVEAAPTVEEIHDDDSFTAHSKPFNMMPYGQLNLQFAINLPADWTPEDLAMKSEIGKDEKVLGAVARFTSPMIGVEKAVVTIDVLKVNNETSAYGWLKNYITASGYIPQGAVIEFTNKSAAGYFTYAPADNSGTRSVYIAARMSGSYVETARFESPLDLKTKLSFLQKKSIDTFKLLNPAEGYVEDTRTFTMVDSVKFTYPASWEMDTPDFRDMNRLLVTMKAFKPETKVVEGYTKIFAIRRLRSTDLKTEIEVMRKFFADTMKVDFKKMDASGKSDAYERFLFNRYEIYDVLSTKAKNPTIEEIHLVVLGDPDWYIFIFMLTPAEATALNSWARNVQSFREMIKSVK